MHDAKKFVPGDRVKIVTKVKSCSDGWDNTWVETMDKFVQNGNVYTIKYSGDSQGYRLSEIDLNWSSDSLELVSKGGAVEVERHDPKAFSKGQSVKVISKPTRSGWYAGWNPLEMDKFVGNGVIYTISEITSTGIRFPSIAFYFPSCSLELAVPIAAQPKGEVSMDIKIVTGVIEINDTNSDKFTDDQLFGYITGLEAENSTLAKTENLPAKITARIERNKADIKTLMGIIDGRPATK